MFCASPRGRRLAAPGWYRLPTSMRQLSVILPSTPLFEVPPSSICSIRQRRYISEVAAATTRDFFDEPVTFLGEVSPTLAASLNGFLLAVCTKGKTCKGGSSQEGPLLQSIHSSAKVWAELLLEIRSCRHVPMAAVAAVGHVLVQANVGYLQSIDILLAHTNDGKIQLLPMAQEAVTFKNDERLTLRERRHLQSLDCLLNHERHQALNILMTLLQQCPGDGLALALATDLCSTLGDRKAALKISGSVAAYWQERKMAIEGSHIGLGLICVGLAAGGRHSEAEHLTTQAMRFFSDKMAGGTASWALAHVMDAEGRVSEGISMLAGNEGMENYEGCGLLFFESRLAGYGARYALDREESGGRTMTLRIYDNYFENVLEYSGYAQQRPWRRPQSQAPHNFTAKAKTTVGSLLSTFFGGGSKEKGLREEYPIRDNQNQTFEFENTPPEVGTDSRVAATGVATVEDVLCWLPPTPLLLSDATLTLFKQTLSEKVKHNDFRWTSLQNSWSTLLSINETPLPPNSAVIASLLFDPNSLCGLQGTAIEFARALHKMGKLMGLAQNEQRERMIRDNEKEQWKEIVDLMCQGVDGLHFWEVDMRVLTEKAFCHAALKSGDMESLYAARSICSGSITLRPNSPEEWMRYSMVLEAIGDTVAAENARSASVSMGFGEGGKL